MESTVCALWFLICAIDAQEPGLVMLIQSFIPKKPAIDGYKLIHVSEKTESTTGITQYHENTSEILTLVFQSYSPIYFKRYLIFKFEKYFFTNNF